MSFENQLLKLVRNNEILYNPELPSYNEPKKRNLVWKKIAEQLNSDSETCQKRWNSLRSTYRKLVKKIQAEGGLANYNKKWKYFDRIAFINDFGTTSQLDLDSAKDQCDDDSALEDGTRFEFECRLLDLVRERDLLYNPENDDYIEQSARNNAWQEIAEILDSDSESCRKRWSTLRGTYRKLRKKILAEGGLANYKRKWQYFDRISFINNFETIAPLDTDYCKEDFTPAQQDESFNDSKIAICKSADFEYRLLELISDYEFLYNSKHPDYDHPKVRNIAWSKIAEELNSDKKTCRKRWKSLRETYRKLRHKLYTSGKLESYTKKWKYYDSIAFINDYDNFAGSSNCSRDDVASSMQSDQSSVGEDIEDSQISANNNSIMSYNSDSTSAKLSFNNSAKRRRLSTEPNRSNKETGNQLKEPVTKFGPCREYFSVLGSRIDELPVPLHVRYNLEKTVTDLVYDILAAYSRDGAT